MRILTLKMLSRHEQNKPQLVIHFGTCVLSYIPIYKLHFVCCKISCSNENFYVVKNKRKLGIFSIYDSHNNSGEHTLLWLTKSLLPPSSSSSRASHAFTHTEHSFLACRQKNTVIFAHFNYGLALWQSDFKCELCHFATRALPCILKKSLLA